MNHQKKKKLKFKPDDVVEFTGTYIEKNKGVGSIGKIMKYIKNNSYIIYWFDTKYQTSCHSMHLRKLTKLEQALK